MRHGLRVCHVVTRLDRGGSAENTILSAIYQAKMGHQVLLIAGPSDESCMSVIEQASVNERLRAFDDVGGTYLCCDRLVRQISPAIDALGLLQLTRLLRRWKPDVVHTHTSKAGILGRVAARVAGTPWVLHTYHGHVYSGYSGRLKSNAFKIIERVTAPLADRLVALTDREMEDHLAAGVGRTEQFQVVPSGVDLEPFSDLPSKSAARRRLGLPEEAVLVGSVGRLMEVKGHRYLVSGLPSLVPGVHVVLFGDGELRGELQGIASSLQASDRLHLMGWRPDVTLCLAALDIFAMPSLNEGMGRAAVEAMAAGLPVVGSRVYGLENVVEDGETGLLVPAGDAEALAGAINRLVESREQRTRYGKAAPLRAEKFSLKKMLTALEGMLEAGRPYVESPGWGEASS